MTAVVGLDLSLTATGLAVVDSGADPIVTTIPSFGHRGDSLWVRSVRLSRITDAVGRGASTAGLVVVEGPSVMSKGGSNWDRAGLWWLVVTALMDEGIPVAVAPPTVVKKWAAGRGNADKASVAAGMTRLWPDVEPGNDNEFDALALATIGAQRLGMPVPSRAHHLDCLSKVEWPESLVDAEAIAEDTRFDRTRDAAEGGDTQ